MKLRLWMSAPGGDDLDVFVAVQKLDRYGDLVGFPYYAIFEDGPVALGWIRASHRELDDDRSVPWQPVLSHRGERKLSPGETVPLEIEVLPSGTMFRPGETLRLVVQGRDIYRYPRPLRQAFHDRSVNSGPHLLHTGGRYDSHLLVPAAPGSAWPGRRPNVAEQGQYVGSRHEHWLGRRAGDQMRLLLIGAPGAGKGTQAELLAERFGITHISSGDLLRQHVRDQTALGQTIKSYLDRGDLVPDSVVMDMLRKPVVAAAEAGGYVLDGFPRTVDQAKASFPTAQALGAEVQAAVHLDVPREELVRRLLARGRGSDDTEAVIDRRLQVYEDMTVPLLEYYAGREWMFIVDGAEPPEAVHEEIVERIQKLAAFGG